MIDHRGCQEHIVFTCYAEMSEDLFVASVVILEIGGIQKGGGISFAKLENAWSSISKEDEKKFVKQLLAQSL